jgi:urease alpha subunit
VAGNANGGLRPRFLIKCACFLLQQGHNQQRNDVDDFDQRINRWACGIFVGIANGVAGYRGFVRVGTLAAVVAFLNVFFGLSLLFFVISFKLRV